MDTTTKDRKELEIRPGNKGPRFVRVYLSVMDSPEYFQLSDGAKAFWLWLLRNCQKPRGGDYEKGREYDWYTDELSDVAGISARSLQRYKGALINAGLLETQKNHNPTSGGRWRDTYIVHEIPLPIGERQIRAKEEKAAPKKAKTKSNQNVKSGILGGDKIGTLTRDRSLTSNNKDPLTPLKKGDVQTEFVSKYGNEIDFCKRKAAAILALDIDPLLFKMEEEEEEIRKPEYVFSKEWDQMVDIMIADAKGIGCDNRYLYDHGIDPLRETYGIHMIEEDHTDGICIIHIYLGRSYHIGYDDEVFMGLLERAAQMVFLGLKRDAPKKDIPISFQFSYESDHWEPTPPGTWGPNTAEEIEKARQYLRDSAGDLGVELMKTRRKILPGLTPSEKGAVIKYAIWEEINEVFVFVNLWDLAGRPSYVFEGSAKVSIYSSLWGPGRGSMAERLQLSAQSDPGLSLQDDPK